MKKLRLDPNTLSVESFDPAFRQEGEGTVHGEQIAPTQLSCLGTCSLSCQQTCGPSCYLTCQFTCYRTCQGGTCQITCQLTCPITCDMSCFTCGYSCDPVGCDPTGPIC